MRSVLAVTALVGIIALTLLIGLWWQEDRLSSESFFESGSDYFRQEKYQEAIIQFLNVLRKEPSHREARFLLARAYLARQEWARAVRELTTLLDFYPEDLEGKLQLGNLYLAAGDKNLEFFREAAEISQQVLEADPGSVPGLLLAGNARAGQKDWEAAVGFFQKALELDPRNSSTWINLGTAQALRGNHEEASRAYLEAHAIDPDNPIPLISLGQHYHQASQSERALGFFRRALALRPAEENVYRPFVEFLAGRGEFEEAHRVLREVQEKNQETPLPSLLRADLYLRQELPEQALALLREIKVKFPEDSMVERALTHQILEDDAEAAMHRVQAWLSRHPSDLNMRLLEGLLYLSSGELVRARSIFERTASEAAGSDARPLLYLGRTAYLQGDLETALSELNTALQLDRNLLEARELLADVHLRRGHLEQAAEEIRRILQQDPRNLNGRLLQAAVDSSRGRFQDAEKGFEELLSRYPRQPEIHRHAAEHSLRRRDATAAERHYQHFLELSSQPETAVLTVAEFYLDIGRPQEAASLILERVPEGGRRADHRHLLALAYTRLARLPDAERELKSALAAEPAGNRIALLLGAVFIEQDAAPQGLSWTDRLVQAHPDSAALHMLRGSLLAALERWNAAAEAYRRALQINPDLAPAANNLAFILAQHLGDLSHAIHWAQRAREQHPENAQYADTLGLIYYRLGNLRLAREQLEFAARQAPADVEVSRRLAEVTKALRGGG